MAVQKRTAPPEIFRIDRPSTRHSSEYEQLKVATLALWQVVKQRLDAHDDELRSAMNRVQRQLRTPSLGECRLCRHPLQTTAKRCLYCGTEPSTIY